MEDKTRAATNLDASTMQYYLRGVGAFPALKQEVAEAAKSNGSPQYMVTQIRNTDTERFENPEEVMQALQRSPDTPDNAPEAE